MSTTADPRGTVAYLGPAGTFTETAARMVTVGDDDAHLRDCRDVLEVLRTVERGEAERGVVPIENTLEGSVTATLDALAFETDLLIHGELELPVTLVLAAPAGTTIDEVRSVRTHVVALGAARRWLSEHLGRAEQVPSASTARAAQEVAELGRGHAAVVNPLAAQRYGLEVLAEGLADRAGNMTRFVTVGRVLPPPTGWPMPSAACLATKMPWWCSPTRAGLGSRRPTPKPGASKGTPSSSAGTTKGWTSASARRWLTRSFPLAIMC
jgi:prephenate dehydratase